MATLPVPRGAFVPAGPKRLPCGKGTRRDNGAMNSKAMGTKSHQTVVSAVRTDGTLIETIMERGKTAFAVAIADRIETMPLFEVDGAAWVPIAASNNLLRHKALLLPGVPIEFGEVPELLDEIRSYVSRYVSLTDEALCLVAAYVLLTWVYDAFNELPYLRFRGDYGTGKTRALLVIGSLCYKAFFASGASTVSPIFHTLDSFKGTLVFDEADFRFTDEKAELVKILNNGNVKGFPVLRTQVTPKKEFDPRAFAIFGPKIVAMRRAYADRALESRFLTIDMEPGRVHDAPINLPQEQASEAFVLRCRLLMYRLRKRAVVSLDSSLIDHTLEPRINQIVLPLLSILPEGRMRDAVRACAVAAQSAAVTDRAISHEGEILGILVRVLDNDAEKIVSLSDIAVAFKGEYGAEHDRPITNRWIGSVLRSLGVRLYKRNGVFVVVPGQQVRMGILRERYGIEPKSETEAAASIRETGT